LKIPAVPNEIINIHGTANIHAGIEIKEPTITKILQTVNNVTKHEYANLTIGIPINTRFTVFELRKATQSTTIIAKIDMFEKKKAVQNIAFLW
jgi:hypothetical protein